jgi:dTDP-4-dehydrorhamnose reductase
MILILGAGYVGQKFYKALGRLGLDYLSLSRRNFDYYDDTVLDSLIKSYKPYMVVNAAGFTGKPNVEACETQKDETILGNVVLPTILARACRRHDTILGHISSGCIYNGHHQHFNEDDEPNFCFKSVHSSFYSGTKAQAEELIKGTPGLKYYIWRLRIPFDEESSPRNYITKMLSYPKLVNTPNSLSHLGDFVESCAQCFIKGVEYGTYNLTNPGWLSAQDFTEMWCRVHGPKKFEFWPSIEAFNQVAKTPRSNCILSTDKATKAGVGMRHIEEAMMHAIENYGRS